MPLHFLTAQRIVRKLGWTQPVMKLYCEQYGHDVNSLDIFRNNITVSSPSQHSMMHWSNQINSRVIFGSRKCRILWRRHCMNSWQENVISYDNQRFLKSALQRRFRCTGRKSLLQQNEDHFWCTWPEPNRGERYGKMHDLQSAKEQFEHEMRQVTPGRHRPSMNHSNIMSNHYGGKSGLRQNIPDAPSPNTMLKWKLLWKKRFIEW